jgi:CubicO group peptidase (beta-lactamase class C family)
VDRRISEAVQRTLDDLVEEGIEIGVQVAAFVGEELVASACAGVADAATGRRVQQDTLFNTFSVSKAITATALHLQAERRLVEYDAPVAQYWPEFAASGKEGVTLRHVLSHESGVLCMPSDVTPERMCDWNWMCDRIARMPPLYPPGSRSSYQSMTFGWIIGEVVHRTDPQRRPFDAFVREEIAVPLNAEELWFGIPDAVEPEVARLDASALTMVPHDAFIRETIPVQVDLSPPVFERPDVRRACIPAVSGIMSARSQARFWAMLANGGTLCGERLLSEERVRSFAQPRKHFDDPEPVFGGCPMPIGWAGFWLGAETGIVAAAGNPRTLCHPGAGGSIGWADPERKLAVAYCHNRMANPPLQGPDSPTRVGQAIRVLL